MLNLTLKRKHDESIVIQLPDGSNIWVTVRFIRGGDCRLSVNAPSSVRVDREEVYLARMAEGRQP